MMEAVCTSETSVDNHFTRQYNPEDSSEHHTRRRENLKSHRNGVNHFFKAVHFLDNRLLENCPSIMTGNLKSYLNICCCNRAAGNILNHLSLLNYGSCEDLTRKHVFFCVV
jgi:hypothetical protein